MAVCSGPSRTSRRFPWLGAPSKGGIQGWRLWYDIGKKVGWWSPFHLIESSKSSLAHEISHVLWPLCSPSDPLKAGSDLQFQASLYAAWWICQPVISPGPGWLCSCVVLQVPCYLLGDLPSLSTKSLCSLLFWPPCDLLSWAFTCMLSLHGFSRTP